VTGLGSAPRNLDGACLINVIVSDDGVMNVVDPYQDRRLKAVVELGVLDRLGDPVLTGLARLARSITGASAAAVHVFDESYQRRIAAVRAPLVDYPAEGSICRRVVLTGTRIITSNLSTDARVGNSPDQDEAGAVQFYASVPIRVDGGIVIGTLCAFDSELRELDDEQAARLEDIAELIRAHLELVRAATNLGVAATLDALTGAVNRAIFDDRLAQALARRKRNDTDVLVAVIDLDEFKAINDKHGHGHGDAALRWVVRQLRDRLRSEDTIGRLGGDEFGLIAEVAGDRIDALLGQINDVPQGFQPQFTVSVGAVLVEDDDDVESVLRRADQQMYAVKRKRRAAQM
jgi:diguanylate cyclase (GGDEF)-like protein